jgi:hypothetical protein
MDNGLRSYSFVTMILIRLLTSKISSNGTKCSLWIIPLYGTEIEKPHFCPLLLCFDHRLSDFLRNVIRKASLQEHDEASYQDRANPDNNNPNPKWEIGFLILFHFVDLLFFL